MNFRLEVLERLARAPHPMCGFSQSAGKPPMAPLERLEASVGHKDNLTILYFLCVCPSEQGCIVSWNDLCFFLPTSTPTTSSTEDKVQLARYLATSVMFAVRSRTAPPQAEPEGRDGRQQAPP